MCSLPEAIAAVKQDAAHFFDPDLIDADCSAFGHDIRRCKLTPVRTLLHFLQQVLDGNASCEAVRQDAGMDFTAAAYCIARQRLPLEVIESLQLRLATAENGCDNGRWCGRRTALLDGTSCSMPDTDVLREYFGYPGGQKPGLGFPSAHLLCLFDHATGLLLETRAAPRATNDMEDFPDIVRFMRREDVLVADRAFGSFVSLAWCQKHGIDAVFRLRSGVLVDFTPGRRHDWRRKGGDKGVPKSRWMRILGVRDQVVVYPKARMKSKILTAEEWEALPEEIAVRELRFRVEVPGWRTEEITLVTTLLDAERYPKEKLAELYLARWKVEGNFRALKRTLKMDILKGKSVDVVKKEMAMHAVAYNLVQLVRLEAARRRGVTPDRISFADAMRWLSGNRAAATLAKLVVNAPRPGRFDVRAVKRRPAPIDLLTIPRWEAKARILAKMPIQCAEKQGLAA